MRAIVGTATSCPPTCVCVFAGLAVQALPLCGLTPRVGPPLFKLVLDLGHLAAKGGHHRRHLAPRLRFCLLQRQGGGRQSFLHAAELVGH